MTTPVYPWPRDLAALTSSRFRVVTRSVFSVSPFTTRRRVQGPVVQLWLADLTHPPRQGAGWRQLSGLVSKLEGMAGQVRLFDWARRYPQGIAAGINQAVIDAGGTGDAFDDGFRFDDGFGFVDGGTTALAGAAALRGAKEILITGLVASQTGSLLAGDLLEVGGYLHEVVGDVSSDATGAALVPIRPGLRVNVAANDVIKFAYASSPFSLASDDAASIEVGIADIADIGLSFVEVVP